MSSLIAALCLFVGAFLRRFFGGWEADTIEHILKIGIVIGVSIIVGLFTLYSSSAALAYAICMVAAFLNPFHAKGQRMGSGGPPSLLGSILWMSGSYGFVTLITGILLTFLDRSAWPLAYCLCGFLVSGPYLLGRYILSPLFGGIDAQGNFVRPLWKTAITADGKPVWFIDSPTAIGELGLGALLIGGLPLAKALFG